LTERQVVVLRRALLWVIHDWLGWLLHRAAHEDLWDVTPEWMRKTVPMLDSLYRAEDPDVEGWCRALYKTMKTISRYSKEIPDAPNIDHFMELFLKHTGIDPRRSGG
jgi:hypothetical protein